MMVQLYSLRLIAIPIVVNLLITPFTTASPVPMPTPPNDVIKTAQPVGNSDPDGEFPWLPWEFQVWDPDR